MVRQRTSRSSSCVKSTTKKAKTESVTRKILEEKGGSAEVDGAFAASRKPSGPPQGGEIFSHGACKDASSKAKPTSKELGKKGEDAAVRFLAQRHYEIVDRNWVCSAGEVDIVAEDEEALVFVEVKTRSNCSKGLPEEAVTPAKRRRYEKIAAFYLRDHPVATKQVRFDVISILAVAPERAFLRHHRNAFSLGE